MKIKIITDSMGDIPKKMAEENNIRVVPLTVSFGEKSYIDGVTINSDHFFEMLAVSTVLPMTSQVPPSVFEKIFEEELKSYDKIIVINGSSKMSGTFNSARIAASAFDEERIAVLDSMLITFAQGFLVVKAARMVKKGHSFEEVVEMVEHSRHRIRCLFAVDTLKYLLKGGRLSALQAVAGSILNIKPILTIIDGELRTIEKARGMKKALAYMEAFPESKGVKLEGSVIGINHSTSKSIADTLEKAMKSRYKVKEILRSEVGSVVGTHSGPGCVALYFEETEHII